MVQDGTGTYAFPPEARPPHSKDDSDFDEVEVDAEWLDVAVDGSMGVSTAKGVKPKKQAMKKKDSKGYWVSFFDGIQRTLIFTDRYSLVENIRRRDRVSSSLLSVSASLKSIGLSVVNDLKKREIIYLGLRP